MEGHGDGAVTFHNPVARLSRRDRGVCRAESAEDAKGPGSDFRKIYSTKR